MGARLAMWLLSAAQPLAPPPVDDGLSCREWAVDAARTLLKQPQPQATGLLGVTSGGLVDVTDETWKALDTFPSTKDETERQRRRLVQEGRASVSTIPQVLEELPRFEIPTERVLQAGLGPANVLSNSFQLWCSLGCLGSPSIDTASAAVPLLASVSGWSALQLGQSQTGEKNCLGLWGFLRAQAGAGGLLGQMKAANAAPGLVALCLAAAQVLPPVSRKELLTALELVEHEWPTFSHTLVQELVFMEARRSNSWPPELKRQLPEQWLPLAERQSWEPEMSTWQTFRSYVFGPWSERHQCLKLARAIRVGDASPTISDPVLLAIGERTLLNKLAMEAESALGETSWLRLARRYRRLRTNLRMLNVALRSSLGEQAFGPPPIDARTEMPLEVRASAPGRLVVAAAAPSVDAEELQLQVPGPLQLR
jgi:hypothetical protein